MGYIDKVETDFLSHAFRVLLQDSLASTPFYTDKSFTQNNLLFRKHEKGFKTCSGFTQSDILIQ